MAILLLISREFFIQFFINWIYKKNESMNTSEKLLS